MKRKLERKRNKRLRRMLKLQTKESMNRHILAVYAYERVRQSHLDTVR